MPGPDPTMMLSALVPSICAAATLMPPRASGANGWKRDSSVAKAAFPLSGLPGIDDDFGGAIRTGADDQVEHAVGVDIAHGHADAAFKAGERHDGRERPVAVAVIDAHLRRLCRRRQERPPRSSRPPG